MIEAATDAFLAARFDDARSLLAGCESSAADLLLVRTLMRLDAIPEAIAIAERLATHDLDTRERGELLVLRYGLAVREGDDREIATRRQAAHAYVRLNDDTEIECELWFFEAFSAYVLRDVQRCERAAWDAIHCDLSIAVSLPREPSRVAPLSNTKARALQLIALVRGSQARFHEQARFLREAIFTLKKSSRVDVFTLAALHMNLSFQARDLGSLDDVVTLELIDTRDWPASLSMMKLEIGITLGWLYALRGDAEPALAAVAAVQSLDAPAGFEIEAIADYAALSRRCYRDIARETLDRGIALCERTIRDGDASQWHSLPLFARELSYADPQRAEALLGEFAALPSEIRTVVSVDDRSTADNEYAKGIVALNSMRVDDAIAHLNAAFEIWVECGFRWQAAMAALDLAKAAPIAGAGFWRYAQREAQNYPGSWLARDVASMATTTGR